MTQKKINVKEKLNSDGELDLSMLEMQDVPVKEIATLKKAVTLNLYNNNISKLPKNFPTLTHIVRLDLSKNCLKELPEDFGHLAKLKHLDLYQNQLTTLPLSLANLKLLKWLDLKENPLEPTLLKVAGPCENTKQCQVCARSMISYLTRLQNRVNIEKNEKAKQKKELELAENKKKDKKKIKKTEITESTNNGNLKVLTKTEKKKLKKLKKQSETKSSHGFFFYFFMLFVLFLLTFVLTSIKIPQLQKFQDLLVNYYFLLIQKLPQEYQKYGHIFGDNIKVAHSKTGECVLYTIDIIKNNEQCLLIYNFVKNSINDLWLKMKMFNKT